MTRTTKKRTSPGAKLMRIVCELELTLAEGLLREWDEVEGDTEQLSSPKSEKFVTELFDLSEQLSLDALSEPFVQAVMEAYILYWRWNQQNGELSKSKAASRELSKIVDHLEKAIELLETPNVERAIDFGAGGAELLTKPGLSNQKAKTTNSMFKDYRSQPFISARHSKLRTPVQ